MISIVIVSYNTKQLLADCLASIRSAAIRIPYEVIVVDNNSCDGSVDMVRNDFRETRVIANASNKMFSIANNQGIEIALGDCFLLLNSDTIIRPEVIETLYQFLIDHKNTAAVGPRLLNADGSLQSQGFPHASFFWTVVRNFNLDLVLPASLRNRFFFWVNQHADRPMRVGWISGACMLIGRSAVEKIGLLNEDLHFYGEEVEWCWRAKNARMNVWCIPNVSILHYGGGSTKRLSAEEIEFQEERSMGSTLVLVKSTIGIRFNLILSCIVVLSCIVKFPFFMFLAGRRKNNFDKLKRELNFVKLQIEHI